MFENRGNKTGLLLTVAFHLLLGTVLMFSGMRFSPSNNPDPLQIEIELEEERPPRPIRLLAEHGTAPRSPQPVPEEEPQFVQQAVVPEEMPGEQRTTESTPVTRRGRDSRSRPSGHQRTSFVPQPRYRYT